MLNHGIKVWLLAPAFLLSLTATIWAADGPKKADTGNLKEQEVYQLGDAKERTSIYISNGSGGMPVNRHNYLITVKSVWSGEVKDVVLAQEKDGAQARALADMKRGEFLTLSAEKQFNNTYVKDLAPYALFSGEDRPNVFAFVETGTQKNDATKTEVSTVKLYKMGKFATVVIPNVKNKDGKMAPDEQLTEAVGKISKGDSVEVATTGGGAAPTLKTIEPYALPQNAVVSKVSEEEVDGAKTPAIEVAIGSDAKTVLVPRQKGAGGAMVPDAKLASAIKAFKKGDKVIVRFREADGKCWLKEITKDTTPTTKPS